MANTVKMKRSGTAAATPSALEHGELAINYADGELYYKNSSDAIVSLLSIDCGVIVAASLSLSQIDDGSFTWTGSGTLADPFVTTYLRSGVPSIRGNSPGNWTSTNRPAWQVTGSGTFNYTITNMDSADQDADHTLYKSTDSGSTWSLVHTFSYGAGSQSAAFSVANGDIIEQRGDSAGYASDTWVENPTVWLA